MNKLNQKKMISNITSILDQSVEELDDNLQLRLDRIRSQSLQQRQIDNEFDESLDPLIMATKVSLDDSTQELNPKINNRLDKIRKAALTQSRTQQQTKLQLGSTVLNKLKDLFDTGRFAIPLSAFATACVLVTVVSLFYLGPSSTSLIEEDVILFASNVDLELYEDLEFFEWLAESGLSN